MGTKGVQESEPDPRVVYADIIDLPHHQSEIREHMSLYDRAAQFAPFAALVGYDDMIGEEARLVDRKTELTEDDLALLNRKLTRLIALTSAGETPEVTVTYFEPDPFKAGGSYLTVCEKLKKIDFLHRKLILVRTQGRADTNASIDLDQISALQSEQLDDLDDEIL